MKYYIPKAQKNKPQDYYHLSMYVYTVYKYVFIYKHI